MKTIAVVITVFNRKDITLNCLEKIYQLNLPTNVKLDIFLTNDGCTDGTPEAIRELYPQVHIINGNGTLYWNKGMHLAWQVAAKSNYDYYLWLNDDTFLDENCIEILLKASNVKSNKAIIAGAVEDFNRTQMTYGGLKKNQKKVIPNGTIQKIDCFNGNIVLIPSYVYNIVGNLDYFYNHTRGDSDYGLRANKLGVKSYEAPIYCGQCESHDTLNSCFDPANSLAKRWNSLHSIKGMPPKIEFYYWRKHSSFIFASYFVLTRCYIRCLLPKLWIKFGRVNNQKSIL
ncbi:glycosyltransferase family 2 protein [Marinifilum sp. RC60d5]|uniref:glycosyltransferase family 2 protein n=1 Tax=Marinifilum sp. RC60d5 TaxID=3458414 RepID=UPI004035D614